VNRLAIPYRPLSQLEPQCVLFDLADRLRRSLLLLRARRASAPTQLYTRFTQNAVHEAVGTAGRFCKRSDARPLLVLLPKVTGQLVSRASCDTRTFLQLSHGVPAFPLSRSGLATPVKRNDRPGQAGTPGDHEKRLAEGCDTRVAITEMCYSIRCMRCCADEAVYASCTNSR
jgi:hypothetical protein